MPLQKTLTALGTEFSEGFIEIQSMTSTLAGSSYVVDLCLCYYTDSSKTNRISPPFTMEGLCTNIQLEGIPEEDLTIAMMYIKLKERDEFSDAIDV